MRLVKRNEVFLPSLLEEIFTPDWFGGTENYRPPMPSVNILDKEQIFEIELAVPGYDKEDFAISIDENRLSISTKKEEDKKEVNLNYTQREFQKYSFKRLFDLPKSVDQDGVKASYENGILKFVLPKKVADVAKEKRTISLK